MKTIRRTLRAMAVASLAAAAFLSPAGASPVVSIDPTDQTINVGDPASIDIIVSGLTDPVGGFSFTLSFIDTIVTGTAFANDPDTKMGAVPLDLSGGFTGAGGSPLDIFFVADVSETEASLAASQGTGFRLARVDFTGIANGLSPLTLTNVVLSNWDGSSTLPDVRVANGSICVGGDCPTVPEPATLLLVATALGVLALRRRKHTE